MAGGIEPAIDRASARWVEMVARRPGLVLAIVGLVTVALGVYAALTMRINADPRALVNPALPFQVRQRELGRDFHSLADGILVVIDGDSPTAAGRAADALAARLAPRTDLFAEVDVPGGGPFFAKNALLYLTTDQLEELTDRLSHVQPFLGTLARDQSLVGVADLLRQALVADREGRATGLDLAPALDRVSTVIEAVVEGRRAPDPWGAAIMGAALPAEARQRIVALRTTRDVAELPPTAPELVAVREAVQALDLGPARGLRVRISGEPVMNGEELIAVAQQTSFVAVVSTLMFALSVIVALRNTRVVLALVGSLLASLIWANGIAALTIGELNVVSSAFNVLIVGLGGEFGIHFAMRYLDFAATGAPRPAALASTADALGGSLLSSAVTTSIGFFIFLLTDFFGVAQLGLIAGFGMFASLASTLTVFPALIALGRTPPSVRVTPMPAWLSRFDRLPIRYAWLVRPVAALVGLAAIAMIPRVHFDYNPVNLHSARQDSVSAFSELLARSDTSPWTVDLVAPSLAEAQEVAKRVATVAVVAEARTLLDYVPRDQDAKREILATTSFFVPDAIVPGPPRTDAERRAALTAFSDEAARASASLIQPATTRLRAAVSRALTSNRPDILAALERDLVGSLPDQIRDLRALVSPDTVRLEDLPPTLSRQMRAPDGRARVQVLPKEDISDGQALERFVAGVRTVAPDGAGLAGYTVDWSGVAWRSMIGALVGGGACMAVILIVLWRSVFDMMLAFAPLLLATLLTCASLAVLGQPFNFANVIVLPMLVGMSVDSGVHLVHRHRTGDDNDDVLGTSTARAVFFSALTTMLSFASLGLVEHRGIAAIGQLLTIGVGFVLVCYVVVLPAILEWDDRRRRRRTG